MQVVELNPSLYKFTLTLNEFSVNMGVFHGEDGILLVDTGWIMTAEDVREKIRELAGGRIKIIIFTHQHGDHIGGRILLGQDATLICHNNARDSLTGKYYHLDPLPDQALPTILVENQILLKFNGEDIRITPAPGHTSSDLVIHFVDSNVIFLGDLLFSESFPALFSAFGGNVDQLIHTLAILIEDLPDDIKIIAGHGHDYSIDDLKEYHQMIVTTSDKIKKEIVSGKSTKEMVEDGILQGWENWSAPQITIENWIDSVRESVSDTYTKSISDPLTLTIMEEGIESALIQYQELRDNKPDEYNFGANELNMLGYNLLWRNMDAEAVEIFKLNTRIYPELANPYDSLAEAYEKVGDKQNAIENYQSALNIDPDMASAKTALDRLLTSNAK